jgi:uncharacterized protein (DUF58 family)
LIFDSGTIDIIGKTYYLTTQEIIAKVRELEIKSKKLTNHLFSGEFHTAFKGKGMRFKEVREYVAGDDPRFIDWNVTARTNHPYTKMFEEERELTVMLLVDISKSSLFGTNSQRKKDLITELCAVLAFSAISNNDKAGLVFFSDKVHKYIAPKGGRDHVLYMVRELLTVEPQGNATNLTEAIKFFNSTTRQKSICFLMSDFISDWPYEDMLKVASKKHDIIGLKIFDQLDVELPNVGLLQMQDLESGDWQWIDSSNATVRNVYRQRFYRFVEECKNAFIRSGSDLLQLQTGQDYIPELQKFFIKRSK